MLTNKLSVRIKSVSSGSRRQSHWPRRLTGVALAMNLNPGGSRPRAGRRHRSRPVPPALKEVLDEVVAVGSACLAAGFEESWMQDI